MDDENFPGTYDDRYSKDEWENGEPAVFVRELDMSVFKQNNINVPSSVHSDCSLSHPNGTSPIYPIQPQDMRSEAPHSSITKVIDSMSFATIPVAVRRLEFKYNNEMSGRFVSTPLAHGENGYSMVNPLLVVPDSVFMGDMYSEIGNHITVYNTHRTQAVKIQPDGQSPIGMVFDKSPTSQARIPVTAQGLSNTDLVINSRDRKTMRIVKFENLEEGNVVTSPALFTTSMGACDIPPGIFFDEVISKDGDVTFYNITSDNLTVSLMDNNFLGYACTISNNYSTIEIDNSNVTVINLNNQNIGDSVKVKSNTNIDIPPFNSGFMLGGKIQIIGANTYKDSETNDESYKLVKYLRVASLLKGCIPMTPLIESQAHNSANGTDLCVYFFNATSETLSVKAGDIVARLFVSSACLPFK